MTPGIPRKPTDLLDNVIRFPINYLTKKSGISRTQEKTTEEK